MNDILQIIQMTKYFGGLTALKNIDMEAEQGQIVGIIGPNGAGKTTLFNCLTGLYDPDEGQIYFRSEPIVPRLSRRKMTLVQRCALIFSVLSVIWLPLFAAHFVPHSDYKVELVLLALFLFAIRWLVARGFKKYQIWAWSLMFLFLAADIYLTGWWLWHAGELGTLFDTRLPLAVVALPFAAVDLPFSLFLFGQLIVGDVRRLYGFRVGPDVICKRGIARTFQNNRLFPGLSVLDNVKIGAHVRLRSSLAATLVRSHRQKAEESRIEADAMALLRFVGLEHRAFDLAKSLAYGEQRRCEIARALAADPKMILLDEPAAGMNSRESAALIGLVHKIRDKGITVLIIEHDMKVMMTLADTIYVLDHGELIARGGPAEIRANPKVIEAYLGGSLAYAQT